MHGLFINSLSSTNSTPAPVDVNCSATISLDHPQTWDCTAGITNPSQKAHGPETIVVDVMSRETTLSKPTPSIRGTYGDLKGTEGSVLLPDIANGSQQNYSAILYKVKDVSDCDGGVVFNEKEIYSAGALIPAKCAFNFKVTMPSSSTATGPNTLTSISIKVPSAHSSDNDQSFSDEYAYEIARKAGYTPDPKISYDLTEIDGYNRFKVKLDHTPGNWIPTTTFPAPTDDSPSYLQPSFLADGNSSQTFQIFLSGSLPGTWSSRMGILLPLLIGITSSTGATSAIFLISEIFQRNKKWRKK